MAFPAGLFFFFFWLLLFSLVQLVDDGNIQLSLRRCVIDVQACRAVWLLVSVFSLHVSFSSSFFRLIGSDFPAQGSTWLSWLSILQFSGFRTLTKAFKPPVIGCQASPDAFFGVTSLSLLSSNWVGPPHPKRGRAWQRGYRRDAEACHLHHA